jgi:hypothetical protein
LFSILFDRCANTKIGDRVTDILSALLNLLTDLEHHEEKLRARHHQASVEKVNIVSNFFPLLFISFLFVYFFFFFIHLYMFVDMIQVVKKRPSFRA